MADDIHLMVTVEPDGSVSADSPQLPGFVMGRPTMTEFRDEYERVLHDVGVRGHVQLHRQFPLVLPTGEEVLLRVRAGEHEETRLLLAGRIQAMLDTAEGARFLAEMRPSVTGEMIVICAAPSDIVGPIFDQLDSRGEVAALAIPISIGSVWATGVGTGGPEPHEKDWRRIEDLGIRRDMSAEQLMTHLNQIELHPESLLLCA